MRRLLALLTFAAMPAAASAAPAVTSAYTPIDMDRCALIAEIEEGAGASWRCPGRSGISLFVMTGDGRFDVDAGVDNEQWESLGPFNRPGPQIEWRLRGGRAFAIIYRLLWEDGVGGSGSFLIVETIGRRGAPGCEVARIDGATANANTVARQRADAILPGHRCPPPPVE
jgi:hypothetical protein